MSGASWGMVATGSYTVYGAASFGCSSKTVILFGTLNSMCWGMKPLLTFFFAVNISSSELSFFMWTGISSSVGDRLPSESLALLRLMSSSSLNFYSKCMSKGDSDFCESLREPPLTIETLILWEIKGWRLG